MFRSNHKTTTNNRKSIATGYAMILAGTQRGWCSLHRVGMAIFCLLQFMDWRIKIYIGTFPTFRYIHYHFPIISIEQTGTTKYVCASYDNARLNLMFIPLHWNGLNWRNNKNKLCCYVFWFWCFFFCLVCNHDDVDWMKSMLMFYSELAPNRYENVVYIESKTHTYRLNKKNWRLDWNTE